ncbi:hypothetical protein CLOP_g20539 [Closterium sp. NIES-67]|nr:hypothetical protein CLOP_g20539 [Closterium sp. NIES-67]
MGAAEVRKLDDSEFKNPFSRGCYIRVREESKTGRDRSRSPRRRERSPQEERIQVPLSLPLSIQVSCQVSRACSLSCWQ